MIASLWKISTQPLALVSALLQRTAILLLLLAVLVFVARGMPLIPVFVSLIPAGMTRNPSSTTRTWSSSSLAIGARTSRATRSTVPPPSQTGRGRCTCSAWS